MAIELNGEILFSDETNGVYVVSTPEILIQTITSTKNVFYITTPLEGLITVNGEPPQGDGGATQVRNKLQSLVDDERLDASAIKNLPQGFSGAYADLTGKPPEWTPVNRTSSYTAANGESVFCNTTSGSFSVTAPSGGGRFTVIDAVGTTPFTGFFINNLTVLPNVGQTIMGTTSLILNIGASSITFGLNGTDWRIIGN